jgi:hypothetical protein
MDKNAEFLSRLTWIANNLKVAKEDLFDWYKNDVEDVISMDGERLRDIVREYVKLKFFYRKQERLNDTGKQTTKRYAGCCTKE